MKNFRVVNCGGEGQGVRSFTKKLLSEMNLDLELSTHKNWHHGFYYTNNCRVEMVNIAGHVGGLGPMIGAFREADHVNVLMDVTTTHWDESLSLIKTALKVSGFKVSVVFNKMDCLGWDKDQYLNFCTLVRNQVVAEDQLRLEFIPASALSGGNVYHPEVEAQWYSGDTAYQVWKRSFLQKQRAIHRSNTVIVLRKGALWDGRWASQGLVYNGRVLQGDILTCLPSRKTVQVLQVYDLGTKVDAAKKGRPVTLVLDQAADPHFLVKDVMDFHVAESLSARIYNWGAPLQIDKTLLIKRFSRIYKAKVHAIHSQYQMGGDVSESVVEFKIFPNLTYQNHTVDRRLGSFYIVDPDSKKNVGLGLL